MNFSDIFIDDTKNVKRINSDEYLIKGSISVIDQGKELIAGYASDDVENACYDTRIIFGDHTRIFKYIDFPFVCGADGTKVLKIIDPSKINYKYMYYYLLASNIPNTGYNRHFKWVKELSFKPVDINSQMMIVNKLDKINNLIDCRKKEIEKCDNLIKSQFVEMFGNIKTNDKKWNVYSNLLNYCVFNPKKNEIAEVNKDTMVTFLPMQNVSVDGVINYSIEKKISEVWKGFTYFKENDVLFAKITPCMENGKGAVAKKLKIGIGFGTTEFHVIRPNKEINSVWLYHVLADKDFRKEAGENMTGSAGQKRVPITFLENYKLAIPPIELQNKFAQIVEQIDKQKFEFENSLKKLEELQASLMQEYFG